MFRIPSALRRPLAVAGAAVVGLAAAVAFSASPASAHHPIVTGTPSCVDGKWQVEWTVTNSETDLDGDITGVESTPAFESDTVKVGAVLPKNQNGAVLKTTQTLGLDVEKAELSVDAHWKRNGQDINATYSAKVKIPRGGCKTSKPGVAFSDDCAGQVTVVVSNGADATKDLRFRVVVEGSEKPLATGTVKPGESSKPVVVPADSGMIGVETGKDQTTTHKWTEPEGGCVPDIAIEQTCDNLNISVTNPPNGLEFDLVFTPSTGEPQTMKVEKGKTAKVSFKASEGLTVTPSVGGEKLDVIEYKAPDNCDVTTPTLPKTGPKTGIIAGGAGGLLVVGAGLFFVARRRRLRFTA